MRTYFCSCKLLNNSHKGSYVKKIHLGKYLTLCMYLYYLDRYFLDFPWAALDFVLFKQGLKMNLQYKTTFLIKLELVFFLQIFLHFFYLNPVSNPHISHPSKYLFVQKFWSICVFFKNAHLGHIKITEFSTLPYFPQLKVCVVCIHKKLNSKCKNTAINILSKKFLPRWWPVGRRHSTLLGWF